MEATLKSGTKVQFRCTMFEVRASGYQWTTPAAMYPKLVSLMREDVAAIVRLS